MRHCRGRGDGCRLCAATGRRAHCRRPP
ncbi:hypothetical protein [Azospira sp. I13]